MACAESRFTSIVNDEIAVLLSDKDSMNTKTATKALVGVLQLYLLKKGQSTDFVSLPMSTLNDLLKNIYIGAQRKNQERTQSQVLGLYALDHAVTSNLLNHKYTRTCVYIKSNVYTCTTYSILFLQH